eukprot:Rmarinus@m.3289
MLSSIIFILFVVGQFECTISVDLSVLLYSSYDKVIYLRHSLLQLEGVLGDLEYSYELTVLDFGGNRENIVSSFAVSENFRYLSIISEDDWDYAIDWCIYQAQTDTVFIISETVEVTKDFVHALEGHVRSGAMVASGILLDASGRHVVDAGLTFLHRDRWDHYNDTILPFVRYSGRQYASLLASSPQDGLHRLSLSAANGTAPPLPYAPLAVSEGAVVLRAREFRAVGGLTGCAWPITTERATRDDSSNFPTVHTRVDVGARLRESCVPKKPFGDYQSPNPEDSTEIFAAGFKWFHPALVKPIKQRGFRLVGLCLRALFAREFLAGGADTNTALDVGPIIMDVHATARTLGTHSDVYGTSPLGVPATSAFDEMYRHTFMTLGSEHAQRIASSTHNSSDSNNSNLRVQWDMECGSGAVEGFTAEAIAIVLGLADAHVRPTITARAFLTCEREVLSGLAPWDAHRLSHMYGDRVLLSTDYSRRLCECGTDLDDYPASAGPEPIVELSSPMNTSPHRESLGRYLGGARNRPSRGRDPPPSPVPPASPTLRPSSVSPASPSLRQRETVERGRAGGTGHRRSRPTSTENASRPPRATPPGDRGYGGEGGGGSRVNDAPTNGPPAPASDTPWVLVIHHDPGRYRSFGPADYRPMHVCSAPLNPQEYGTHPADSPPGWSEIERDRGSRTDDNVCDLGVSPMPSAVADPDCVLECHTELPDDHTTDTIEPMETEAVGTSTSWSLLGGYEALMNEFHHRFFASEESDRAGSIVDPPLSPERGDAVEVDPSAPSTDAVHTSSNVVEMNPELSLAAVGASVNVGGTPEVGEHVPNGTSEWVGEHVLDVASQADQVKSSGDQGNRNAGGDVVQTHASDAGQATTPGVPRKQTTARSTPHSLVGLTRTRAQPGQRLSVNEVQMSRLKLEDTSSLDHKPPPHVGAEISACDVVTNSTNKVDTFKSDVDDVDDNLDKESSDSVDLSCGTPFDEGLGSQRHRELVEGDDVDTDGGGYDSNDEENDDRGHDSRLMAGRDLVKHSGDLFESGGEPDTFDAYSRDAVYSDEDLADYDAIEVHMVVSPSDLGYSSGDLNSKYGVDFGDEANSRDVHDPDSFARRWDDMQVPDGEYNRSDKLDVSDDVYSSYDGMQVSNNVNDRYDDLDASDAAERMYELTSHENYDRWLKTYDDGEDAGSDHFHRPWQTDGVEGGEEDEDGDANFFLYEDYFTPYRDRDLEYPRRGQARQWELDRGNLDGSFREYDNEWASRIRGNGGTHHMYGGDDSGGFGPRGLHASRRHVSYVVGRSMFETDRIPHEWVNNCNQYVDEIWVPSKFNFDTFTRSGVCPEKVHIIPEAVDTDLFNPALVLRSDTPSPHRTSGVTAGVGKRVSPTQAGPQGSGSHSHAHTHPHKQAALITPMPLSEYTGADFHFLSVFKWEPRKNWKGLLTAYYQEFHGRDDSVCLVLRVSMTQSDLSSMDKLNNEVKSRYNISRLPCVHVLSDRLSSIDMVSLYAAADAFVLPSHGEGWGLPLAEAMAMELPCIATRWGGSTEFMTEENSFGIDIEDELVPSAVPDHFWSQPLVDHTRELMRYVLENREEATRRGKQARQDMVALFSSAAVAERIKSRLAQIQEKLDSVSECVC